MKKIDSFPLQESLSREHFAWMFVYSSLLNSFIHSKVDDDDMTYNLQHGHQQATSPVFYTLA